MTPWLCLARLKSLNKHTETILSPRFYFNLAFFGSYQIRLCCCLLSIFSLRRTRSVYERKSIRYVPFVCVGPGDDDDRSSDNYRHSDGLHDDTLLDGWIGAHCIQLLRILGSPFAKRLSSPGEVDLFQTPNSHVGDIDLSRHWNLGSEKCGRGRTNIYRLCTFSFAYKSCVYLSSSCRL